MARKFKLLAQTRLKLPALFNKGVVLGDIQFASPARIRSTSRAHWWVLLEECLDKFYLGLSQDPRNQGIVAD